MPILLWLVGIPIPLIILILLLSAQPKQISPPRQAYYRLRKECDDPSIPRQRG